MCFRTKICPKLLRLLNLRGRWGKFLYRIMILYSYVFLYKDLPLTFKTVKIRRFTRFRAIFCMKSSIHRYTCFCPKICPCTISIHQDHPFRCPTLYQLLHGGIVADMVFSQNQIKKLGNKIKPYLT